MDAPFDTGRHYVSPTSFETPLSMVSPPIHALLICAPPSSLYFPFIFTVHGSFLFPVHLHHHQYNFFNFFSFILSIPCYLKLRYDFHHLRSHPRFRLTLSDFSWFRGEQPKCLGLKIVFPPQQCVSASKNEFTVNGMCLVTIQPLTILLS